MTAAEKYGGRGLDGMATVLWVRVRVRPDDVRRVPREALKYLYSYSQRREVSAQIIQAQPAAHLVGNVSHVN